MYIRMSSNKQYVMTKCSMFTRKQNLEVLKFLQEMDVKICSASDGSRINLDALSKRQIGKLKRKVDEIDVPVEPKYRLE